MTSGLFKEANLQSEPWSSSISRLKLLVNQLLVNPASREERAIQVFVRETLLQVDSEARLLHKAIVIDVNQSVEAVISAGLAVVGVDVATGGAAWFARYGLNVTASEARHDSGLPLFFVLWKQTYLPAATEKSSQA